MQWQGSKNFVSRWSNLHLITAFAVVSCFLQACEYGPHETKTLRVVLPQKQAVVKKDRASENESEKVEVPVAETEAESEPQVDQSLEEAKREWTLLEESLVERGLGKDDLLYIEPRASEVEDLLEKGDSRVKARIIELRRRVSTFELKPGYVWQKLERVRAKFSEQNLAGQQIQDYQQRLEAIPRLIEEDRLNIANSVLSDVYFELDGSKEEN